MMSGGPITDFLPQFPRVRRITVLLADMESGDMDQNLWVRALQGLVNRAGEPHLYVMPKKHTALTGLYEQFWLDRYREKYGIPVDTLDSVDEALERYRNVVNGYVVYDNQNILQTQNIALTMCALDGVLPVSPEHEETMRRHGIPKKDDLRGKWTNDWDAAEWAIDRLWPRCNRHFYANMCIHRGKSGWMAKSHHLEDYIVYNRVFCLDLPRSRVFRRSIGLFHKMMRTAEAPGVQLNWHCIWDQEKEYIAMATRYGFFSLCSVTSPNLTIHGGVGDPEKGYSQPLPPPEQCVAQKGKVYVCFYNSDGDATWAVNNLMSGNWLDPDRGAFPFGWGFLPLAVKMMPAMMEYYHETRLPGDCFFGPSSGAAYTYTWAWPEHLVRMYLKKSRRLLDQSGQNGCNMVNWYLEDYWREVEDDRAVALEKEILGTGPGLVCGLGGSPYAKSYPAGGIPKVHSVHIANVGRDNAGDIIRFTKECPTRPLFMFLFAQINRGIFRQLNDEMGKFADYPEIEIVSMDRFCLLLQDAVRRGLVGEELYEKTPELAETWLRAPGRNRLPLYRSLCHELDELAHADFKTRAEALAYGGWTHLTSIEVEGVAATREKFTTTFADRKPTTLAEENDALFYVLYQTVWGMVRSCLESQGVYANSRVKGSSDFAALCGKTVDPSPYCALFEAWDRWEEKTPDFDELVRWCDIFSGDSEKLLAAYGPREGESFNDWPPKSI